jgi:prolipoprotein diacylglyceryltransferase
VLLAYLAWYGFGRMLIEGLRTDSLYIGNYLRVSQLVGGVCFVVFTTLIIVMYRRAISAELVAEGEDYVPMYGPLEKQQEQTAQVSEPSEEDAPAQEKNELNDTVQNERE